MPPGSCRRLSSSRPYTSRLCSRQWATALRETFGGPTAAGRDQDAGAPVEAWAALDDGAAAAAWSAGQAMTLEQAVAYALQETPTAA